METDAPNTSADNAAPETLEIVGLPGGPITVSGRDDVVSVVKPDAGGDTSTTGGTSAAGDASTVADSPDKPVADALGSEESAKKDAAPADKPAGDKGGDSSADDESGEAADEEKTGADDDESGEESDDESEDESDEEEDEEKPDDEEKDEDKPAEEREPSEVEQLVEGLGGAEVLKAAQPLIEAVNNPDATPEERYEALKQFIPEDQLFGLNNNLFWDAVQNESIQKVLVEDPEAREIYARSVYGVPAAFVDAVIAEQKELYTEAEIAAYGSKPKAGDEDGDKEEPSAKAKAAEKPAAKKPEAKEPEKKEEKKPDAKKPDAKPDAAAVPDALMPVLDQLNGAVEAVVQSHKLEGAQVEEFETEWPKVFGADKAAVESYTKVKAFADKGKTVPPALALTLVKHSERLSAALAERLAAPKVEKAKATAAHAAKSSKVRKETPGAKAAAASSTKGGAGDAPSAITGIAARFPGGVIPDPDSPEFARYLEEEVQRKLAGQ